MKSSQETTVFTDEIKIRNKSSNQESMHKQR